MKSAESKLDAFTKEANEKPMLRANMFLAKNLFFQRRHIEYHA